MELAMLSRLMEGWILTSIAAFLSVTSTARRRWKVFRLLYTVDLYVQDPIGFTF